MKSDLEATGERVIEDAYMHSIGAYTIFVMHAASYGYVESICKGKKVLDLGCGSGYGTTRISHVATEAHGVDVSSAAIDYATEKYRKDNLHFRTIEPGCPLPYSDGSFDVVLSFQVIEHVLDDSGYIAEASRLLAPGGKLVVITPDRQNRLFPWQKPWNRWHLREYDINSLFDLVNKHVRVTAKLKMGAPWKIASVEIKRYRLTKWLCLPFTLPWVPESLRIGGLNLIHRLVAKPKSPPGTATIKEFSFDETAMIIAPEPKNSLNLIIVAQAPGAPEHA